MTKNPLVNAFAALVYIILVVLVMQYMSRNISDSPSLIIPIAMLSLFTLSAAVMGYIFLSQPLRMFLDGSKKAGIQLFLQTLGFFAGITVLILFILLAGSIV